MKDRQPLHALSFALHAGTSLFRGNPTVDIHRETYDTIARFIPKEPLNRDEEILPAFLEIAQTRAVTLPSNEEGLRPYWSTTEKYNPLEVFGTLVQLTDYHDGPLPLSTLPPESDVETYIRNILNMTNTVTLPFQFEELLNSTDNNLLGAMNLGFVASRLMARRLDHRAYPNITVGSEEMFMWNDRIAQFETYGDKHLSDGPGDTYYFWSHMFGALFYKLYEGIGKIPYNFAFEHGTETMKFVRQYVAKTPITADHNEASLLGRNIGLAFSEIRNEEQNLSQKNPYSNRIAQLPMTVFQYLFTNNEYAVYKNPEQYEAEVLSSTHRRNNLARGVADVVEAATNHVGTAEILDIGAGTGILSLELCKRGFQVTALDLFAEQLELLHKRAVEESLDANIFTVQTDMNTVLPFSDNSFDAIVSLRASRYITNFAFFLDSVCRVLKPTGVFVLPVFGIDTVPWKRHSDKGIFQETSIDGITKSIVNVGLAINDSASKKYNDIVDLSRGHRDVPFYYRPTFIVAEKR